MRPVPSTVKIAILDDYQCLALDLADWSVLPKGTEIQVFTNPARDGDELVARLLHFDVIIAMRERTAFPSAVLERLPQLALLASTGLSNAAVDIDACQRLGITVCGSPGHRTGLAATAETAWVLILALAKRLISSSEALHDGRWQPELADALMGRTLGLIGLGRIGKRMARVGVAFGMDVVAWSPHLTFQRATESAVRLVSKTELLGQSDVISLHMVLAPSTAGLVGRDEIAIMKSSAVLINTARAALIDEEALLAALRERRIGGVGLDVFWQEPLSPSHPLLQFDNVVLTPHIGYATRDNLGAFYASVIQNIATWLAGHQVTPLSA